MPTNILYYSNFCVHSNKLLNELVRGLNKSNDKLLYVNVDNQCIIQNKLMIKLQNKRLITLPSIITSTPSLLLLTQGLKVICGYNGIINYFNGVPPPVPNNMSLNIEQEPIKKKNIDQINTRPPLTQSMGQPPMGQSHMEQYMLGTEQDVVSSFSPSFSSLNGEDNYSNLGDSEPIYTPKDDYEYNKKNNKSLEELQKERESSLQNL